MIFDTAFRAREPTTKAAGGETSMTMAEFIDYLRTGETAKSPPMGDATYFICQRVLAESMGKLPLKLVRKTTDGGTEQLTKQPLYHTLRTRPNRYTTACSFQTSMEFDRNEYGNAFAWMRGSGKDLQLWELPPPQVSIWWDNAKILADTPYIWYRWSAPDGRAYLLSNEEVIHFRGWYSLDGITGLPVRDILKTTIGGAISAQQTQGKLFENGMVGKAVLQYTGDLSPANANEFTAGIQNYIDGKIDNSRTLIPLPFGATLTPIETKLTDAQFLELRKFTALQVAAAFGVKPDQINDYSKSSYSSSEAQEIDFLISTLLWRLENNVQELNWKLLNPEQRADGWSFDYNTGVLLKPTIDQQIDALQKAVAGGIYMPNEARNYIGLPAATGGDRLYFSNGSAIPMELAGKQYDKSGGGDNGNKS